jgi:hypothetical protein
MGFLGAKHQAGTGDAFRGVFMSRISPGGKTAGSARNRTDGG